MTRVILITGTRKGIGKYLAEYYLERGDFVAGCSRSEASINNPNYFHSNCDVTNDNDVAKFTRSVKRKWGRVDVLINNAGIASMNHILTMPSKKASQIIQTNFIGTFNFVREVSKIMISQKKGRIVNMSTVAVPMNLSGEAVYAASKSAVESFTRIAAFELGEFGITINTLAPTPTETDLIKNVPQDKIDTILKKLGVMRLGTFEDIVNVINFYISDKSSYISGQTIYLGGVSR